MIYSGFRVDGTSPKMSFRWGPISTTKPGVCAVAGLQIGCLRNGNPGFGSIRYDYTYFHGMKWILPISRLSLPFWNVYTSCSFVFRVFFFSKATDLKPNRSPPCPLVSQVLLPTDSHLVNASSAELPASQLSSSHPNPD